jgi:hypothetical protein
MWDEVLNVGVMISVGHCPSTISDKMKSLYELSNRDKASLLEGDTDAPAMTIEITCSIPESSELETPIDTAVVITREVRLAINNLASIVKLEGSTTRPPILFTKDWRELADGFCRFIRSSKP